MTTKTIMKLHRKVIRDQFYVYWQNSDNNQALLSLGREIDVLPIINLVLTRNPLWKTCAKVLLPMVSRLNLGDFFDNDKKIIRKAFKNYMEQFSTGEIIL